MSLTPTHDTALSRPDLGQAVFETMDQSPAMGFIGMQALPVFPVSEATGTYPVIPKEELHNLHKVERTASGGYNRFAGRFEEGFYKTADYGLEVPVDDRFRAMYKSKFDMELTLSNILMNNILRAQEYRVKAMLFNTSNFSATNAGTSWATHASADPKSDVETAKNSLRGDGIIADTIILNYTAFMNARLCDAVQDVVYQLFPDAAKTGQVTMEHLKTVFDLPKVLVAGGLYNSSKQGQAASLSDIWGAQYCMICKTADPGDDITQPCIGRTMMWNDGFADGEVLVEEYRDESVRGNILRVRHDVQNAFLASYDEDNSAKSEISKACGYLLDATAAS